MRKNKKMTILAASLVLSLALSVTVTDRVKGREEGRERTLWAQVSENAMKAFGRQGEAAPGAASALPEEEETKEGITAGEAAGSGPGKVSQSGPGEREVVEPEAASAAPKIPGTAGEDRTEVILPGESGPKAGASSGLKAEGEAPEPAPREEGMTETTPSSPSPASPEEAPGKASSREGQPDSAESGEGNAATPEGDEADARKETTLQLTAAVENGTITMQYNHAERLEGEGIAFGLMGFRTGTREGTALVRHYAELSEGSALAAYLPALEALERMPRGEKKGKADDHLAGLTGFLEEVQGNEDPLFRRAQLEMLERLYWVPAAGLSRHMGMKHPLTLAFLYDMMVDHGEEGTRKFLSKADYALGGTPAEGVDEEAYLRKLMDLRETYLGQTGNASAERVAAYRGVLDAGNMSLRTPFSFTVNGATFRIDGKLQ